MDHDLVILNDDEIEKGKISQYGVFPNERSGINYINLGFLVLDKPTGPTSHDVVATIKKILEINKAGHSGTLDPNVSGVLPVGLSNGTKILNFFQNSRKEYICNLRLITGISESRILKTLKEFEKRIYQVPPLKSNVVKKLRIREIYKIDLLERSKNDLLLRINCEAGTYIRTFCVDFGKAIGVGSFMNELRRSSSGNFNEKSTISLHELYDAYIDFKENDSEKKLKNVIHPIEEIVDLPRIIVKDSAINSICQGNQLAIPGIIALNYFINNQRISLVSSKGELIAIGMSLANSEFVINNDKGNIIQPEKVIMKRSTYPN